jgi:hypothetical protein
MPSASPPPQSTKLNNTAYHTTETSPYLLKVAHNHFLPLSRAGRSGYARCTQVNSAAPCPQLAYGAP